MPYSYAIIYVDEKPVIRHAVTLVLHTRSLVPEPLPAVFRVPSPQYTAQYQRSSYIPI